MRKAFTLIELLVVISIIALLISILLPVLSSSRYEANNFLCINRQRQFVIATTAYCTDSKEYYPDRGIYPGNLISKNTQSEPMWARWAARMYINPTVDGNLDKILGKYMDKNIAVWCCPMYDGDHGSGALHGCTTHGKGHSNDRWTTYSFHGGLREWANRGHTYNPGNRLRLGDPYIINLSDGTTYKSNILISDTSADDNSWVPCVYPDGQTGRHSNRAPWPGITTNHVPKPGTLMQRVNNDMSRVYAVGGRTYTNWAYDDGSAEVRIAEASSAMTDDDWTKVISDPGGGPRYMLFPN